ncbi:MAG: DUF2808 domain-containing protein [Symploca sp. SIO2C1]|nr:DUF2808 domain-containing protein [Symploca sp. SIO2C1]
MLIKKSSIGRLLGAVAVTSCLLTGFATKSSANGNCGFTLWSGVPREHILCYHLDFDGEPGNWDRYRLRIPSKKMELRAAQFVISYPENYKGKFDTGNVEVKVDGDTVLLQEDGVVWDKERRQLQIYLYEPTEADKDVEIILSNVRNPNFGGTYYFNAKYLPPGFEPGRVEVPRYIGTWILSISRF